MNRDGTIRWTESPILELSETQIQDHALKPGTLLISRSGTVGPVALYDGPEKTCVAGAYLIEFGIADTLEPEYVRTLFMTPYVQQVMQSAVQSAAIPNINVPSIKRIAIPIPPKELQLEYSRKIMAIREWQSSVMASTLSFEKLKSSILIDAFTGELTATWREKHASEIAEVSENRSKLFKAIGTSIEVIGAIDTVVQPDIQKGVDHSVSTLTPKQFDQFQNRSWLVSQLSNRQRAILRAFTDQGKSEPLLADHAEALTNMLQHARLEINEEGLAAARKALEQLAALGLISKVSVQVGQGSAAQFVTAFIPIDMLTEMSNEDTVVEAEV